MSILFTERTDLFNFLEADFLEADFLEADFLEADLREFIIYYVYIKLMIQLC
jgi:hypothetical protein